jgi:hypothetical protein
LVDDVRDYLSIMTHLGQSITFTGSIGHFRALFGEFHAI